jgi:hypothetical protein
MRKYLEPDFNSASRLWEIPRSPIVRCRKLTSSPLELEISNSERSSVHILLNIGSSRTDQSEVIAGYLYVPRKASMDPHIPTQFPMQVSEMS